MFLVLQTQRATATLSTVPEVSQATAPAALAEPAQKGAVGAEQTTFKWTGQAYGTNIAGEPCGTDHSCEDILVEAYGRLP